MALDNSIPSEASLLEFSEVYSRAILLAWSDDHFKKLLLEDPLMALQNYFHYKCPWNITLKVEDTPKNSDFCWNKDSNTWNLPPNSMTFGLPIKPCVVEEEAIALMVYNDAGPSYLFTCC